MLKPAQGHTQREPRPGAVPRNSSRGSVPASSIADSPLSVVHRLSDDPAGDDPESTLEALSTAASGASSQGSLTASATPRIVAAVNHGVVEFRVSAMATAVSFETLQEACAEQLPHVVLQHTEKWLQYTFDLWSHGDSCLYAIPIASIRQEPAGAGTPLLATKPKARRRAGDLAAHHPRG